MMPGLFVFILCTALILDCNKVFSTRTLALHICTNGVYTAPLGEWIVHTLPQTVRSSEVPVTTVTLLVKLCLYFTTMVQPWYSCGSRIVVVRLYHGRFCRGTPILVNFDRSPEIDERLSKSGSNPVWVLGLRIDQPRLVAGCRKRRLNHAPLNLRGLI